MVCSLVSMYFDSTKLGIQSNKMHKTLEHWSRDMLHFDYLEKDLGTLFPPHFVYNFSRKVFLMLYSINWLNFIVWLALILEMLGNMCITIFCFPGCDVINFEINFVFLIKPFFYMPKNWRQKFKYFESEKSFKGEMKNIFHHL